MRYLFLLFFTITTLFGAAKVVKVDKRYQESHKCQACHGRIVKEWRESWHSKSHYTKDEYFRKSLDYVSRKTHKSLNSVKVKCATCHNPHISVTSTDEDDASKRGINRVKWTASGTMTGPFKDAVSPYHKTIHHEFMDKNPNKLCFVCHANDRSISGMIFSNMQGEFKGSKKCVECHMGEKHRDVAATYRMHGKVKMRDLRNHGFRGAHTDTMWKDALALSLKQKKNSILVTVKNPQPHNIPSGFGARELELKLVYKNATKVLGEEKISLTSHYLRKRGKKSTPHLALKQSKNMSIPAHGEKVVKVKKMKGATNVEVTLSYILVNEEVRSLLKLEGDNWSKRHFIAKEHLDLK